LRGALATKQSLPKFLLPWWERIEVEVKYMNTGDFFTAAAMPAVIIFAAIIAPGSLCSLPFLFVFPINDTLEKGGHNV
jgi:hypothetical protein